MTGPIDRYGRNPDQDLELWKHHASFGGEDKSRMVTIASLLLGFSSTILGYFVATLVGPETFALSQPIKAIAASAVGIVVSALAAYVALLYGGYANQNWEKADQLAENRGWLDLLPSDKESLGFALHAIARRWARPCKPAEGLPPVFTVFVVLAMLSLVAHLTVVLWSVAVMWSACSNT